MDNQWKMNDETNYDEWWNKLWWMMKQTMIKWLLYIDKNAKRLMIRDYNAG